MWGLAKLDLNIEQSLMRDIENDYDFRIINSFSPDDFVRFMKRNPSIV